MFSSRPVWYLPVAILTVTFFLYASIGLWFSEWIASDLQTQRTSALSSILSAETIDALYEDARLHHALLSLTEAVAQASNDYGESYSSDGLKKFGKTLTEEVARLKSTAPQKKKRGLFDGALGGDAGAGAGLGGEQTGGFGGILAGIGNALGIGGGEANGTGLGDQVLSGLSTPALFLGIGIGMGVETGLNITDMESAKAMASQVASTYNVSSTGINSVAQSLGSGLSSQLAPAFGNATNTGMIGMAAFSLAQGIGQGTSSGLGLTEQNFQPSNDSNIMSIAGNLGLGISSPIAGSLDVMKLVKQVGGGNGQLMQQIPQIAAAAGQGLGQGATNGLGLQRPPQDATMGGGLPFVKRQAADPNQIDVPAAVQDFTRGLSESFLQSADLGKVANMVVPPGGPGIGIDFKAMIVPLASGAGKGIGDGLAIGLGFKPDMPSPPIDGADVNMTAELTAEEFTRGLVSKFLTNSTAPGVIANMTLNAGGGLTASLQPAKAAEGFARGMVEGSINAISMAGGIESLISGNFSTDLAFNLPSMAPSSFNDSINGSAVAFARGLSGEGTLLIAKMIQNMTNKAPQKRDARTSELGLVPYNALERRQEGQQLAIRSDMLQNLAQAGTDAITCQGFGGIASLALGLMNSGKLKIDTKNPMVPLDNQTIAALPKDPITITSEGNRFTIKIVDMQVTVNDLHVLPFAITTAAHVLLTTIAFFYALPIYIALGALLRLSVMIGYPFDEASNKKWRKIVLIGVFFPTALAGIILGFVGMGSAAHLTSAHGIFGLLALIFTPPAVIVSFYRLNTTVPQPGPTAFTGLKQIPTLLKGPEKIYLQSAFFVQQALAFGMISWIQGFSDLRAISLCIVDAILTANAVAGLLNFVLFIQVAAMALFGLRVSLEQRIAKQDALRAQSGGGADKEMGLSGGGGGKPKLQRTDTMATFGFDSAPPRQEDSRPNTEQLLGREDSQIGWPSEVRKFETNSPVLDRGSVASNPFLEPGEGGGKLTLGLDERGLRRVAYDPDVGGYVTQRNTLAGRPGNEKAGDTTYRPSSEVFESERVGGYGGLEQEREAEEPFRVRYESFSRPRPSGEDLRNGFGVGGRI